MTTIATLDLRTMSDDALFAGLRATLDALQDNQRRLALFAVDAHTERVLTDMALEHATAALVDGVIARGGQHG